MNRTIATLAATFGAAASLAVPAVSQAASAGSVLYDSTPKPGTVSVPSVGPEAYAFNRVGNEVLLRNHQSAVRHVSVTMSSWACQSGDWQTGCTTKPGAKFRVPITLNLYRYAKTNRTTGVAKPGARILSVTKTFSVKYRPSSVSAAESRYMGSDGVLHNGIAQTITFPVNVKLPNDVVWTVSYNTNTSGIHPLSQASPADSLNVGLSPNVRVSHDRVPGTIMWDTRFASFTGGAPFVTGELNRDSGWAGYVPAARFSTR